jgi:thiol-disulfide isomerase/thioredoxin
MKPFFFLHQILLLLVSTSCWSQSTFNTHFKADLSDLNKEYDSLIIEVRLFDSFLGDHYRLYKSFSVSASIIGIDITLPEISMGIIEVKNKDSIISGSGSIVFSGDTLTGSFGTYNELIIRGGENEFMQENFMLPFNLPSIIKNNSSFKNKMVHRSYTLQIPENPMLQAMYKEYLRNVLSLVKDKSSSFHILRRLLLNADNITFEVLDTAYSIIDERVLNTIIGKRLRTYIANGKWLQTKPDLNNVLLEDVNNRHVDLQSILDSTKFTYIDFWASWCAPCREFNEALVLEYDSLNKNKIQVISISLDTDKQKWKQAISKDKIPWLNYIDPTVKGDGFSGNISQLFNIQFIPQSFLFDKNGNIVNMNLTIKELLDFWE